MSKVLVIETDSGLSQEIVSWLVYEGHEAISAADGVEGVSHAYRHQPDLIICDIDLPRLNGYGVLADIQTNLTTNLIPFIFLTTQTALETLRKSLAFSADDYVAKPFARADLLHTISMRLAKKAAQDKAHQQEINLIKDLLVQERQHRLLQAKLVAMFSHDFRNPLSTILTSTSTLRDYADRMDETRRLARLNNIEVSVRRLMQMLDDMLIIAQIETGNLTFTPEALDIAQFVQNIINEFRVVVDKTHQIIFKHSFTDSMLADHRLLRQIISNLISNAIKYSPVESEINILLDKRDGACILTIEDHGVGITAADQTHLFEVFQRGSNVGRVTGTGLGLAIVKQAVDLHGGSISVKSEVGVGTTVTVAIPSP